MRHHHVFRRYELAEKWAVGRYRIFRVWFIGYHCECGEEGYALP